MCFAKFSNATRCCHCITDLKTASAIIAVLAMVTSPAFAWAIIRHSYVIRVSCYITTSSDKEDVVDINLNNVVTFGFGANAGLNSSCFNQKIRNDSKLLNNTVSPNYAKTVQWMGWIVLSTDLLFVFCSLIFLIRISGADEPEINTVAKFFICCGTLATILSFIYGLLYVVTCFIVGGNFPLFELAFTFIDLIIWTYFLLVVNAYRRSVAKVTDASTKISIQSAIE